MALTYDTWYNSLFNALAIASTGVPNSPSGFSSGTDPQWTLELPRIIEYAEQRIYRDLDLLNTRVSDVVTLSSGVRGFPLPTASGNFVVPEEFYVVTPSSASASDGTLNQLTALSRPYLFATWPSGSTTFGSSIGTVFGVPVNYAMADDTTVLIGPAPDAPYQVVCAGTIRPVPLSSGNQTTYLTRVLPDLFYAATMVKALLFARDWGGAQDDPQAGATWEQEYQRLLKSADMEEARKQHRSAGWTTQQPRQVTTPPRQ